MVKSDEELSNHKNLGHLVSLRALYDSSSSGKNIGKTLLDVNSPVSTFLQVLIFWNTRSVCFVISVIFRVTVFSLVLLEKSSELAHSQSEEPKMEIIHLGQNLNQLVSNSSMADPHDSFNLGMGESDYPKTVCQMDLPIKDQTPKKTKMQWKPRNSRKKLKNIWQIVKKD